jgi:hypothetical protein
MTASQHTQASYNAENDTRGWAEPVLVESEFEEETDTDDKGKDAYSG